MCWSWIWRMGKCRDHLKTEDIVRHTQVCTPVVSVLWISSETIKPQKWSLSLKWGNVWSVWLTCATPRIPSRWPPPPSWPRSGRTSPTPAPPCPGPRPRSGAAPGGRSTLTSWPPDKGTVVYLAPTGSHCHCSPAGDSRECPCRPWRPGRGAAGPAPAPRGSRPCPSSPAAPTSTETENIRE